MQDFDSILFAKLHDIQGLHSVSIFPLAPGWWMVLFLIACAVIIVLMKLRRIRKYRKSWRYALEIELVEIINNEASASKENISKINDILKRLSIQQYGREESASLTGKTWLAWLSNRDPHNFNWLKHGEILVEYPYMSAEKISMNHHDIAVIAKAAKPWLKVY